MDEAQFDNADSDHYCPKCGKWFERKDTVRRHLKTHDRVRKIRKSKKKSCVSCIRCKVKCSGDKPSCERCSHRQLSCCYEKDGQSNMAPTPPQSIDPTATGSIETQQSSAQSLLTATINGQTHDISLGHNETYRSPINERLHETQFYPWMTDPNMFGMTTPNNFNDILTSYLGSLPLDILGYEDTFQPTIEMPSSEVPRVSQPSDELNLRHHGTEEDTSGDKRGNTTDRLEQGTKLPRLDKKQLYSSDGLYPRQFSMVDLDDRAYRSLQDCLRAPLARIPWQTISLESFPSKNTLDWLIDLYFAHFDQFLPMIHRPTFDPGENLALTLAMCAIGACYSDFESKHEFAKTLCEMLRRLLLYMGEYDASVTRNESHLAAQLLQSVLGKSSGSKRLYELGDNNRGIMVANARGAGLFDHKDEEIANESGGLQAKWESWIRAEKSKRLAWCIYIFDASATYYRNCRPNLSLFEVKMSLPCSTEDWEAGSAQAWVGLRPWTTSTPVCYSLHETIQRLFEAQEADNCNAQRVEDVYGSKLKRVIDGIYDEFSRMLVVTTLIRDVWDLRESQLEPTRLSACRQPHAALPRSMDAVLCILEQLTTNELSPAALSINRPSRPGQLSLTERQFRGLVLRARVSLIAQIIAADTVTDHLALSCFRQGTRRAAAAAAEKRLLAWAKADPTQPRKLAHVGAKLLAISRLYPFHYPREPFDALQGGMLVWAMLRLMKTVSGGIQNPTEHVASSYECSSGTSWGRTSPSIESPSLTRCDTNALAPLGQSATQLCKLDWLGSNHSAQAEAIRQWIKTGDGFNLTMHGIADLQSPEGERQVLVETSRVLNGLNVWGITKTYSDTVLQALQNED